MSYSATKERTTLKESLPDSTRLIYGKKERRFIKAHYYEFSKMLTNIFRMNTKQLFLFLGLLSDNDTVTCTTVQTRM